MGRAARWLKSLFGVKIKEKERNEFPCGWSAGHSGRNDGVLCNNPATIPPNITPSEAAWLRSFYSESDKERNKHAIAVAAAQAAVAVVRLTSQGRGAVAIGGSRERSAAVRIQKLFRGFLARKALRALKGLVKIQALVRGFLVRKQANATLRGMQALIRAQSSVRAWKARNSAHAHDRFHQFQSLKHQENAGDRRNEHPASLHSRRLSASFESYGSPKIVEVDTGCRGKSRSRTANPWLSDSGEDFGGRAVSSPLLSQVPARLSVPDGRHFSDRDWDVTGEECHFSTAQSTPRFAGSCGCNAPSTPARSVCVESYFSPNYMANTQSFNAKLRSHSAPKQRPEPSPRRRMSLHEMMGSRNSLSLVRMQRSCSQATQQHQINFKNVVIGNLGRSTEFGRGSLEQERSPNPK